MISQHVKPAAVFMGRVGYGTDLLEEFQRFCQEQDIQTGQIWAIGAVEKARIGYYDQTKKEYDFRLIDRHLEITGLIGNISILDDRPFVHAHITLADAQGAAFGGHLAPGTVVYACEFLIQKFEGVALVRDFDPDTGLNLWR
jgi:predicted DNA-binding protein with PD1-like motif